MSAWKSFGCCAGQLGSIAVLCLALPSAWSQGSSDLVSPLLVQRPTNVVAGPYNGWFLQGGVGLTKPLHDYEPLAAAQRSWSMSLRLKTEERGATTLLAGVGRPQEAFPRYLALIDGRPAFWSGGSGSGHVLEGDAVLSTGVWHSLAVSVDQQGITWLYADGVPVASGTVALGAAGDVLEMAPASSPWPAGHALSHFGGHLAQVSLLSGELSAAQLESLKSTPAGLDNLPFEEGSKPWFVQTRGPSGMHAPQDPSTLPRSAAAPQAPVAVEPLAGKDEPSEDGASLTLRHAWQMADAATVKDGGSSISAGSYDSSKWMRATVPGTVLTTLIDRGVYPNPDYGLNNLAIPESLSRKSFWFRTQFTVPSVMHGRQMHLTFDGINYRATVWLNGTPIGEVVGAFRKKSFNVTANVKQGASNTLAVLIEPPPHGGIAHEQSLIAGSGDNGGVMMLDGPTFGATEGWDWIPGIRDRNMGLWQDVVLTASGAVRIDVPQIITKVSLPDARQAQLTVRVPLANATTSAVRGTLAIDFDDVHLSKAVTVLPGGAMVEFAPKEFSQLVIDHPRLWWPNGYGAPELHTMNLVFKAGAKVSDSRKERFGIRELTYEISAFDRSGHVRRVEVEPTEAELLGSGPVVEQTHEGFRETPQGWVTSLVAGKEDSPALRTSSDDRTAPFLVIKVNGVRIAIKGGAWGMDDMLKRVSRERMEPFFRLHREANLNMIRNWMGQDTEDIFYELADEYGMLIWNDFWISTQDWNLEPDDAGLFLENAKDTIHRYRNHPSIAVWCGRNEGVPPPTINRGLAKLIYDEDGTRYYSADSNKINLHDSGPYKYQEPEDYFTKLSLGFAVEVGVASPPTLEAFQAFLPKEDQWPINDDWAYHDWHQGGNGDTAPFMETMSQEFGAPTSLADFDLKAQMINYEAHRAIFEGFNAHLWSPNSGRLLWMTQPAWPSTQWQIFSHDYDTQASFFAVKKAAEQIHVQMNLPTHDIAVVNNSELPLNDLRVRVRVFDTAGKLLQEKTATVTAPPNATTVATGLDLTPAMETAGVVLVKLELKDSSAKPVSDNFYWLAGRKQDYRRMDDIAPASLTVTTHAAPVTNGEGHITVTVVNNGTTPAIAAKLTLVEAESAKRVLPAYYSDNYVSLLPGETKVLDIAYPQTAAHGTMSVNVRGWNVPPVSIQVVP